jgi:hypothetical protein
MERKRLADENGLNIDVLVCDQRFVFKNPFTNRIESWARPRIEQPGYHDGKPTQTKSTFLAQVEKRKLILEAFGSPAGIVKKAKQINLYRRFDYDIGTLKSDGGPTKLLCVQCDREKASSGNRYQTRLHGYPYSEAELQQDLQNCPLLEIQVGS